MTKKVVLVTGGTGLVGNGIRIAHERDPRDDEKFIFLSSKDADLTDKESTRKVNSRVNQMCFNSTHSRIMPNCARGGFGTCHQLDPTLARDLTHLMFEP